jgi:hypothetical protein
MPPFPQNTVRLLVPVLACIALMPMQAGAQTAFGQTPSAGMISPGGGQVFGPNSMLGSPGESMIMPSTRGTPMPLVPAGQVALTLSARFGKDTGPIGGGLDWRVYSAKPDPGGNFKLVREEKAAAPTLVLPAGNYIVHVDFGLATAVKPVILRNTNVREEFDLPAGGLRIEGRVGNTRVPPNQISFEVFKGSQFEPSDRRPIAEHVLTGAVLVVPEGTYYIVSNYGDANAVVRSDIRVQAGKLTDITVNHRAAAITLKLVADKGGEALANTAWSVLTPGGDVIKESIGAFPRVILAEGEYRAIARNEGKVYERDFKVVAGVDGDVEVMAR